MNIETGVSGVTVEIEGGKYPVAPKTVSVAKRLREAAKACAGRELYRLWLKRLKILIGKDAVSKLFPNGENENLDRMELIYLGVMDAFDAGARSARQKRDERVAKSVNELAKSLMPLRELIQAASGGVIRRGAQTEEKNG